MAELNEAAVVTGSRDQTARLWEGRGTELVCTTIFRGHARYIMSVATVAPSAEYPNGLIVTGSLDQTINVYDPQIDAGPLQQLTGHTDAVCCVTLASDGALLSSSWDGTAKVWRDFKCTTTLKGHERSVLGITAHPTQPVLVTCSADLKVKLWTHAGVCTKTFEGHTDVIRAIVSLDQQHFATCANDGTVRVWSYERGQTMVIPAHDSFIYSLTPIPGATGLDLATGSEDGTVKIWRGGAHVQTIAMPATSIWSLSCRANGDLIVGSDDGIARIFSLEASRWAPDAVLAQFDELVESVTASRTGTMLGDVDKRTLPGMERLDRPGTKDNETVMINQGDKVTAYSWSQAEGTWQSQGVVTDTVDDYVTFQIELDNKKMMLKHKKGDNPYLSAQQ